MREANLNGVRWKWEGEADTRELKVSFNAIGMVSVPRLCRGSSKVLKISSTSVSSFEETNNFICENNATCYKPGSWSSCYEKREKEKQDIEQFWLDVWVKTLKPWLKINFFS